jgi:hypothetical protein
MENREVLVKLQYTTKYGVQLHSSRVLRNFNLCKYLVLKHIPEQVYIDYSNEDCELVNLKELFDNSFIITDKTQIESFNNLKQVLYKDINVQYDLFTLIDNAYNDVFGHIVEKDLAFDKYTYFFKQFLELSKSLMVKYTQFIGTDDFPKDMNQLYLKELGNDRYEQLLQWLQEPVINDINLNCVLNYIINTAGLTVQSKPITNCSNIPLHKEAMNRLPKSTSNLFTVKEKVIITKNSSGFYTFKNLIFNLKTSLVIGKWNTNTMMMDKLSLDDIELCKCHNLKYDETKVATESNETNVKTDELESKVIVESQTQSVESQSNSQEELNTLNSNESHVTYENMKNGIINNNIVTNINELKTQLKQITNDNLNGLNNVATGIVLETNSLELLDDQETDNIQTETQETIDPYSSNIIPITNDKVSRGRKKTGTVITGTTPLKQRASVPKKTGK